MIGWTKLENQSSSLNFNLGRWTLPASLVRLVGSSALLLALFWLLLFPNFLSREGAAIDAFESSEIQVAQLSDPSKAALEKASFELHDGERRLLSSGYYAVRSELTIEEIPERGIGLIVFGGADNARHFVNGMPLPFAGSMERTAPSYHRLRPSVEQVPTSYLREGQNTVETIHVIGEPARRIQFWPPVAGEYGQVMEATEWRLFLRTVFLEVSIVVGYLLATIIGVVAVRAKDRDLLFWLFLLCLSWSTHSLFFGWAEMPIHGQLRSTLYAISLLLMSACWPILIDAWSENKKRWFRFVILAAFFGASIAAVLLISDFGGTDGWSTTEQILDRFGIAMFGVTLVRLVWHFIAVPTESRHWEAAIFVLLGSLLAMYLFNLMLLDRNLPYLRLGQPIILFAFAIMFFSRNFQLFRSTEQINALLQAQLSQKAAALEAAHTREKDLVRRQAHDEERRRLMRDMHDGLGSHLMAMLVTARGGKGKPQDFADGIQQVIDEMRLMIESLDSVGDNLDVALTSFRKMMEVRIAAAGFRLDWRDEMNEEPLPDFDPRTTLQAFRIMQEAVTNSLKHSGGDRITIAVRRSDEVNSAIELELSDNGHGADLTSSSPGGHGLRNMKVRAASIGAALDILSDDQGTSVSLHLGLPTSSNSALKTANSDGDA